MALMGENAYTFVTVSLQTVGAESSLEHSGSTARRGKVGPSVAFAAADELHPTSIELKATDSGEVEETVIPSFMVGRRRVSLAVRVLETPLPGAVGDAPASQSRYAPAGAAADGDSAAFAEVVLKSE